METGQHVERRAVDAGSHLEIQVAVGFSVFVGLQADKHQAKQNGQGQTRDQLLPLVRNQPPMRPGQRDPGTEQQQCVDRRDPPRMHRSKGILGRGPGRWPLALEALPKRGLIGAGDVRHGQDADIEQGAEKCREEHDLRKNEPGHGPTEGTVHLRVVTAALGFSDDAAKPAEQHDRQDGKPAHQHETAAGNRIHCHHGAACQQQ